MYYSITETQVAWVLEKCTVCTLQAANRNKPPVKPIKARRCQDRLVIDLIDFSSMADRDYKRILQIKDPFSRYIWLYALKDKSADTVCTILKTWFGQNGLPAKL
jgi:hypothetical protein